MIQCATLKSYIGIRLGNETIDNDLPCTGRWFLVMMDGCMNDFNFCKSVMIFVVFFVGPV